MAIKVSQATIDKIKKMGMTKALSGAKSANPEMREALTRMYGARRVSAAGGSSTVKYKSADAARAAAAPVRYKSADAARAGAMTGSSTSKKKTSTTPTTQYATGRARGGVMTYTSPTTSRTSTTKPATYKQKQDAAIKRVQAVEKQYNAALKNGTPNKADLLKKYKAAQAAVKAIKPTVVK